MQAVSRAYVRGRFPAIPLATKGALKKSLTDCAFNSTCGNDDMRRLTILVAIVLVVASCSPEEEATGSTNKCATDLYSSYNPKVLDQCATVCIKCDRGNRATCSTWCTLKGAR
jgi:hypothetical protein